MTDVTRVYPADEGGPPSAAIRAASLVVIRDGDGGLEVLMLRRPPGGNFGGFWVFPGGKVDAADHSDDDAHDLEPYRRAAAREAVEECGLGIAADDLVTLSYWEPPPRAGTRFGTWFFTARHPGHDIVVDGAEIVAFDWVRPFDAHQRRDAGDFDLAPPTWVTLHTMGRFATVDEVLTGLGSLEAPPEYRTRLAKHDDATVAMWSGDAGYEPHDAAVPGARHRLVMGATHRFEYGD